MMSKLTFMRKISGVPLLKQDMADKDQFIRDQDTSGTNIRQKITLGLKSKPSYNKLSSIWANQSLTPC